SMSCRTIRASCGSGKLKISVSSSRAKTVLPAPIDVMVGMMTSSRANDRSLPGTIMTDYRPASRLACECAPSLSQGLYRFHNEHPWRYATQLLVESIDSVPLTPEPPENHFPSSL